MNVQYDVMRTRRSDQSFHTKRDILVSAMHVVYDHEVPSIMNIPVVVQVRSNCLGHSAVAGQGKEGRRNEAGPELPKCAFQEPSSQIDARIIPEAVTIEGRGTQQACL